MPSVTTLVICLSHRGRVIAGMVNSIPLLTVGWKSMDFPCHFWWPNVTKLHRFAPIFSKIFPRVTPWTAITEAHPRPILLGMHPPSHFIRASIATAHSTTCTRDPNYNRIWGGSFQPTPSSVYVTICFQFGSFIIFSSKKQELMTNIVSLACQIIPIVIVKILLSWSMFTIHILIRIYAYYVGLFLLCGWAGLELR